MELEDEPYVAVAKTGQTPIAQTVGAHPVYLHIGLLARHGGEIVERSQDLEQGRLSGTRRPDHRNDFPGGDLGTDPLEHLQRAEGFVYVDRFYHLFCH